MESDRKSYTFKDPPKGFKPDYSFLGGKKMRRCIGCEKEYQTMIDGDSYCWSCGKDYCHEEMERGSV